MKTHYSCAELAALKLPGYPTTREGWSRLVKKWGLDFVLESGRGRLGGVRKYLMPENLPRRTRPLVTRVKAQNTKTVRIELFLTIEEAERVLSFLAELRARRG